MSDFGKISSRSAAFRQALIGLTPLVCTDRAMLVTKSYQAHEQDPVILRRAYSLQAVLEGMTIFIEPYALLAGNQASSDRAAPIFPEYAMHWLIRELDDIEKRDGDRFLVSEKAKEDLRSIYPYWKGRTLQDKAYNAFPDSARLIYDLGIIRNEGNITSGDAHLAVDYRGMLQNGLAHYRERAKQALAVLDMTDPDSLEKSWFYKAVTIVIDGVEVFSNRYARLAEQMAAEAEPERAKELLELARICGQVPMQPARTFHEALQSLWLVHLVLQIESNGHSLSFGRFDQYLYPYYLESRGAGMTEEQACELLENLWLKTLTVNKIRSGGHSKTAAGNPMYQNVTIGGQTVDGEDATNELTRLTLKSVARVKLPQPNLSVRYHKNMPQDFLEDCIRCIRLGFGMPAFNNDEIAIPALLARGVSREDAYDYSAVGCIEISVPGKWGYRCSGMSYLNFPRTLMIALNNGVDVSTGKQICQGVGHFLQMESFDDVMAAWDFTARKLIHQGVILDNTADIMVEKTVPDVLCSALVADCLGRGRHLKEGGAVYDMICQLQVGVANLGDCLAAIKKLVYEEKRLSREELWDALINDYQTPDGPRVRALLLSTPKYGNDDDYVDSLVVQGYDTYLTEIPKYKNTRFGRGPIGGIYFAGTSSVAANISQGIVTCATPDGRRAGQPLAEGCSPAHGADKNGPTAVFKSVSKLKTAQITGGVLLNQKISPSLLANQEGIEKFSMLIRTFFDELKGWHVQYNVVDKATLLDAQQHPENHRDLIVRVAGYSAFFHILSRQTQDDIIGRTEQVL